MTDDGPVTLGAIPGYHAQRRPDHVAILCEGRETTYRTLHRESNRTANTLRANGLPPGARVGYLGRESEHYYDIAFGCAKSGTVLVPVNWRLTSPEVRHILRDSDVELLFVEREFEDTVTGMRGELPRLGAMVRLDAGTDRGAGFRAWKAATPEDDPEPCAGPGDPAAQLYTSGTTGLPKGVVLPHRSFFALAAAMTGHRLDWLDWRPDDRSLIGLPGLNIAGLSWSMQGFEAGVTNVVMRAFIAQDAVQLIRQAGVTMTFVAPAMLQMMLAEPSAGPDAFASLRKVAYGGSPIGEDLLTRCMRVMEADFIQAYAATETGNAVVLLPPADHEIGSPLLKSAGRACPGVDLRIVDQSGRPVPPGVVGEVCVRTDAVMLGYWQQPEATEAVLSDGWLSMGDAGYLDENGYLFLRDRIRDTVIVAGQNVYPAEVENAIDRHPAVAEAAVIGIPHERWGEAVHACVVLKPGEAATPRQLMLSLRGQIADYNVPTSYEFVDILPRNASGKVLRRRLRERFNDRAQASHRSAS
jgi:acyl-CoA synthetase (AMP-forming)/AMP-acid ligase II